ncbi:MULTISPECIES: ATP-binding protein [Acidobacteriaceae]|uniref:ATP-binding protein n=1 Tax=Acidobacteriaceae TaxID=204434 RepID=UPI0020B174AA|nr:MULTISPECIES: ATP-binding protein [Acidobacteriaceae]MDW5266740.1 ATP-binding protein [Edaphobacter sp.]
MAITSEDQRQMRQWQAVLDSAGEGIWGLDLEGRCTFVNRMATKIMGFESEELLGGDIHELVHHHDSEAGRFPVGECPIYDALRRNTPLSNLSDTMFRKDGSTFVVEMSAHPVSVEGEVLGIVVTFSDVTSSRQQEEDLRKARELAEQRTAELNAVIESMPHGVYIATPDGKMRTNRWARTMSGERFPAELKTLEGALAGEASTETVRTPGRWIQSVAAPVLQGGKITGGVAVNTDVTQARLQDEALRKSEKLAAVGQLASSIAHEINNPLESITNLLYLVQKSDSMEEMKEYALIAQQELARVTEITLQTLRFHRQQSKPVQVDLADLLRTVMTLYTGRLLVRRLSVEIKLADSPPVLCLEGEIRQVFNNLLRNALDAMSEGGRLLVRLHRQTNWVSGQKGMRLTVADTGEGISPEMVQHLFEPFQTTKELMGTGLGLWVSKGIVEKHNGHIRARTRRGESHSTVFTVWLPVDGGPNLAAEAN